MNAYELLGLNRDASPDQIKSSYHKLLLVHHPDKNLNSLNDKIETFIKIQSAFRLLSNHESRKTYDSLLKQMEIKQKANDLLSNDDECIISLEQGFDLEPSSGLYWRICRCGGSYYINKTDISKILKTSFNFDEENLFNLMGKDLKEQNVIKENLVISLECDTCSLVTNVCIL